MIEATWAIKQEKVYPTSKRRSDAEIKSRLEYLRREEDICRLRGDISGAGMFELLSSEIRWVLRECDGN